MTAESDAIIDKLDRTWTSIIELCRPLTEQEWKLPTECPGWTVQDNVSHLIGTERMLQGEPATTHRASDAPYVRNDIGRSNEHEVDARRGLRGEEVLREFEEVTGARLRRLRSMTDDEFAQDSWTPLGPGTLLGFLEVRVLDCWVHEQDIRRALGRPGHLDGPAAEHTIDRMWRTLPATVAKRAGAPDGSVVVVELTGPVHRAVTVRMTGGRAMAEPSVDPAPTVRLAMPSDVFVVLTCGRQGPDGVSGITVEGDPDLARRILTNLNVMI